MLSVSIFVCFWKSDSSAAACEDEREGRGEEGKERGKEEKRRKGKEEGKGKRR